MGLYPAEFAARIKERGIVWFAVVSTLKEAKIAAAAGAGCHRCSRDGGGRPSRLVRRGECGTGVGRPLLVASGNRRCGSSSGCRNRRDCRRSRRCGRVRAGASAVQIGTRFLRCPEAEIPPAWAEAIGRTAPEDTVLSRVFSGRAGRSVSTAYVRAATAKGALKPAPYPVQRGLTAAMRSAAVQEGDIERMRPGQDNLQLSGTAVPPQNLSKSSGKEPKTFWGRLPESPKLGPPI